MSLLVHEWNVEAKPGPETNILTDPPQLITYDVRDKMWQEIKRPTNLYSAKAGEAKSTRLKISRVRQAMPEDFERCVNAICAKLDDLANSSRMSKMIVYWLNEAEDETVALVETRATKYLVENVL